MIIDELARASAAMSDLLGRIAADQWTAPTPCTEWDVRGVANHLVGVNLVFVAMFEENPMPDRDADHLGGDPAKAWGEAAAALQETAARPGVLEQSRTTPLGTTTVRGRLQWRIADLLAHAWDLRQATGHAIDLPDALIEQSLAFVQAELPNQSRAGRFDEPQPIDDAAPALDRLAAFTGRKLSWTP